MQQVFLSGQTTEFSGYGRKLGYPTANIEVETDLKDGVYFGYADLAEFSHHPALIFIGVPTSVGDTDRRVEAYLLDIPDKDYYGENLTITIEHYLRGNKTFDNLGQLQEAIHDDEIAASEWFKAN